ncbi:hypothetical protein J3R82DRAFT_3800 [Butyriboletus roseoflavus]|nr:hypothetical protein J3R82DRAFT_3800 [Butyriboletus roseoflavus]
MPHPSLPSLSARAHKPLISFIGKRIWPSSLAPAHPHPAAPPEYRKTFSGIHQQTLNTARTTEQLSFPDFWDAPARFWRPKHRELQEFEIDAIQVCETFSIMLKDIDNTFRAVALHCSDVCFEMLCINLNRIRYYFLMTRVPVSDG